jgi:Co/Zn/Cd efflux system component
MSVQRLPEVTAHADLTVLVSRNAPGDLRDGVRHRLQKIDAVRSVDDFDIRGLRPGLNDLAVEVSAALTLAPDAAEADASTVEAMLVEGFGIRRATATVVETYVDDR